MRHTVSECERCNAKIVEQSYNQERPVEFIREPEEESFESKRVRLCSMCLDDIWEFVFDVEIDRSEKCDPIPLSRVDKSVERYISDLEKLLEELGDVK